MSQPLFAIMDGEHSPATTAAWLVSNGDNDASEFEFCKQASLRGWKVVHGGARESDYDVIVRRPDGPAIFVQVKGALLPMVGSHYQIQCRRNAKGGGKRAYGPHAFHVLAFHMIDADKWVFYTRPQLGNRTLTTYALPEFRKNKVRKSAPDARDPDNWELLDEVAQSFK